MINIYNKEIKKLSVRAERPDFLSERAPDFYLENRLCGDQVACYILEDKGPEGHWHLDASGSCIICRAASALVSDYLSGHEAGFQKNYQYRGQLIEWLGGADNGFLEAHPHWQAFESLRDYPARHRCVTLPWEILDRISKA